MRHYSRHYSFVVRILAHLAHLIFVFASTAFFILASQLAYAAPSASTVTVHVTDASNHPLTDAVVYAEPLSAQPVLKTKAPRTVEIEQKDRKFLPLVTVIQTGTDISFPNNDTVRHHVYSFSPAKIFDIKLYSGNGEVKNFDKPGTVVLGCNIHDQMVGYIHIVNTPYFAKTELSGNATLEGLAPGKYRLKAWHYDLPVETQVSEQTIELTGVPLRIAFKLATKTKGSKTGRPGW